MKLLNDNNLRFYAFIAIILSLAIAFITEIIPTIN